MWPKKKHKQQQKTTSYIRWIKVSTAERLEQCDGFVAAIPNC